MLPALTRILALAGLVAFAADTTPSLIVPNFPDLTIRTRFTANKTQFQQTWYFKGPRQRMEQQTEQRANYQTRGASPRRLVAYITQCDQKANYILDEDQKTYLQTALDEQLSKEQKVLNPPDGAEVIVTNDSVDTGERRAFGSYEARRVKTTTTFEPSEEAGMQPSKMETDGWYLDLPGWNCRDDSGQRPGFISASVGHRRPRFVFRQLGDAHRGFPVEEQITNTQAGTTSISKIEFVEISEQPLDAALFEVPKDYTRVDHFVVPASDAVRPGH